MDPCLMFVGTWTRSLLKRARRRGNAWFWRGKSRSPSPPTRQNATRVPPPELRRRSSRPSGTTVSQTVCLGIHSSHTIVYSMDISPGDQEPAQDWASPMILKRRQDPGSDPALSATLCKQNRNRVCRSRQLTTQQLPTNQLVCRPSR